jgi:hypothetical protein
MGQALSDFCRLEASLSQIDDSKQTLSQKIPVFPGLMLLFLRAAMPHSTKKDAEFPAKCGSA